MIRADPPEIHPRSKYNGTEAARLLCIDRGTLRNYRLKGYIEAKKSRLSNRPYYSGADLMALWKNKP